MRNWDSPYLTDWFTISIRWLVLLGLSISLGLGGEFSWFIVAPLAVLTIWNGFVSVLAIFNLRLAMHRLINVVIDVMTCISLFYFSGMVTGPLTWISLLPIATASLYYELRGALVMGLVISFLEGVIIYLMFGPQTFDLSLLVLTGFNAVSAIVIGLVAIPLLEYLRKRYLELADKRKEGERRAQQHERQRMRALFEMIETFSATLNYQTVLETALETGISALGADTTEKTSGAVLLFGEHDLEVTVARHFFQQDLTAHLPALKGAIYETIKSGECKLVTQPSKDPELSHLSTLNKSSSVLCLPLIRGMNAFGVMLFAHPDAGFFGQERIDTLQMVSNQAVIAIQNARLYQDLAREKERIVQTQEEAQKKLARDLHDGPTQSISAIAMRLNIARKLLERSPQEAMEELNRIEELARRTTDEIRHMLFTLRPLIMESEGLEAALKMLADRMKDLYQQNVSIAVDQDVVQQLDPVRQTVVFAIADEGVNNARKHAKASNVWVRIRFAPNDVCTAVIEVIDNGAGFDVNEVMGGYDRRGSMGMVNLRERADQVNGLLRIDSMPGKGTRMQVLIPLTDEAADRLHQSK